MTNTTKDMNYFLHIAKSIGRGGYYQLNEDEARTFRMYFLSSRLQGVEFGTVRMNAQYVKARQEIQRIVDNLTADLGMRAESLSIDSDGLVHLMLGCS